jgi:hypothetical protein
VIAIVEVGSRIASADEREIEVFTAPEDIAELAAVSISLIEAGIAFEDDARADWNQRCQRRFRL